VNVESASTANREQMDFMGTAQKVAAGGGRVKLGIRSWHFNPTRRSAKRKVRAQAERACPAFTTLVP